MSYLGRSAKLSLKAQEKVSFLATAGQTVKTGLSYVPSFVEVYVNGVLLTDTTDFTATNGNSITFTVALLLNDEVTVISLKTFTVADHYSKTEADTLLAAKATVANFTSTGIDDNATSTAITIDASENVGIGTASPDGKLEVEGSTASTYIRVKGTMADGYRHGYELQNTHTGGRTWSMFTTNNSDGVFGGGKLVFSNVGADSATAANSPLVINAAGIVTKPLQPSFMARGYASRPSGVVLFSSVPHNVGSHYNNSNGRFTAPIAGNYLMTWFANAKSATHYMNWALHINGNEYGGAYSDTNTANYDTTGGAMVVSLAAGDYVNVYSTTGYPAPSTTTSYSFFSGYLLG